MEKAKTEGVMDNAKVLARKAEAAAAAKLKRKRKASESDEDDELPEGKRNNFQNTKRLSC